MKTFFVFLFAGALTATAADPNSSNNNANSAQPAQASAGVEQVGDPVPKAAVKEGIQAGADQVFDVLDTNKDGKLSAEEFQRIAQPAASAQTPANGGQAAQGAQR
jgi:hypothetical protein